MKKRELLEEIKRIQEMMEVEKPLVNEQLSSFLSRTLPKLGQTFEHNFFSQLRRIVGKDLTVASPKELSIAFKHPNMAAFRKQVADQLIDTEFDVVNNILTKYDLTIPQQSQNAGKELAAALDIDPAFLKDVKASWVAKKGGGTAATTAGQAAATATAQTVSNVLTVDTVNKIVKSFSETYPEFYKKGFTNTILFKDNKTITRIKNQVISEMAGKTYDEICDLTIKKLDDLSNSALKHNEKTLSDIKIQKEKAKIQGLKKSSRGKWNLASIGTLIWTLFKVSIAAAIMYALYKGYQGVKGLMNPGESSFLKKYGEGNKQAQPGQPSQPQAEEQPSVLDNLDLE